ncbi:MAG: DUF4197 domain-containing protein [Pseudomonadota bacterium]
MKPFNNVVFALVVLCSLFRPAHASDLQSLLEQGEALLNQTSGELDVETVAQGLKEALDKGSKKAVSIAGIKDGYLANPKIKIPLPDRAEKYGKRLKKLGLGKYVDQLETSINRAAEKAAPLATELFVGAIQSMSIEDAYDILRGDDDSATQYFQEKTRGDLTQAFYPSIDDSLSDVGAIKAYDKLQKRADKYGLGDKFDFDMSDYVTQKSLDGLFLLVAEEEKNIRENPTARTTELLQQVFE